MQIENCSHVTTKNWMEICASLRQCQEMKMMIKALDEFGVSWQFYHAIDECNMLFCGEVSVNPTSQLTDKFFRLVCAKPNVFCHLKFKIFSSSVDPIDRVNERERIKRNVLLFRTMRQKRSIFIVRHQSTTNNTNISLTVCHSSQKNGLQVNAGKKGIINRLSLYAIFRLFRRNVRAIVWYAQQWYFVVFPLLPYHTRLLRNIV